ncbi:MAG: DUF481 domain-containing protein [Gammaproteobacteria bacterium]|nr:DUF481 domain-containing protein [Gammaproteobacteria bacterium]
MDKKMFLFLLVLSSSLQAEGWQGEGELGVTLTSGNSETQSWNGRIDLKHDSEQWRNSLGLQSLKASNEAVVTAERYVAALKSDYKFKRNYAFLAFRYEDDRFSGYDYQTSLTLGLGRRFWDSEGKLLDLSIGLGNKRSSDSVTALVSSEAILRGGLLFSYPLNKQVSLSEELLLESGQALVQTQSVTALAVNMSQNLAAKFSLTATHNSQVPVGSEKTDTITAVSLLYRL